MKQDAHLFQVGWILVEWDNGNRFDYRYGSNGIGVKYDLVICDEPRRIPQNDSIATGCLVRKGYMLLCIPLMFLLIIENI